MQVLPIPPHVMTPMGPPSPTQLRVVEPFPVTIHQMQLPTNVKKSYELIATKPTLAKVAPLHHQLDSLRVEVCLEGLNGVSMCPVVWEWCMNACEKSVRGLWG